MISSGCSRGERRQRRHSHARGFPSCPCVSYILTQQVSDPPREEWGDGGYTSQLTATTTNTGDNQLKKRKGFLWLKALEVSVHDPQAPLLWAWVRQHILAAARGKTVTLCPGCKKEKKGKGLGPHCAPQGHSTDDPRPPTRHPGVPGWGPSLPHGGLWGHSMSKPYQRRMPF